jgi:dTMP kinase
MAKPPGIFIVLECIDGTGKSTQARRLGEWYSSQGREVVLSREPKIGKQQVEILEDLIAARVASHP